MGYGSRAMRLLTDFYEGKFANLSETETSQADSMIRVTDAELESSTLQSDNIKVRDINNMPPLFSRLSERRPQALDYLGVSFGLTPPLHKFWKRASFAPVYLRQTANELTGEHSCVMIRKLSNDSSDTDNAWLGAFSRDFHKRFLSLLSYQFRTFPSVLALSIIESANAGAKLDASFTSSPLTKSELDASFSPFDLKRLDSYANNMLDYHVILDMIPPIAHLYFTGRLKPSVSLTGVQSSILLAIGLQRKILEDVEKELGLPTSQLLAMFVKIVRKVSTHFRRLLEGAVIETMPQVDASAEDGLDEEQTKRFAPLQNNLDQELKEAGENIDQELKEKQRALIDALPLDKYEIETGGAGWEEAEKQVEKAQAKGGAKDLTVSVKTSRPDKKRKGESAEDVYREEIGDKETKRLKKGMRKAK
ncbi:hypothetical protein P7C71_g5378, partial [Lecanoromycetidae sp. Uapishka_2]